MGVGLQLKAILRDQKMTIKQLAEKTGISINTLYSITKRDSSSIDPIILKKIATALNVPFWKLLGGTETNDGKISFSIHLDSDTAASLGVDKLNHGEQLSTTIDPKSPAGAAVLKSLGIETSNSTQYKEVLFSAFDRLNEDGQKKAIERVEELTEIPKYQKRNQE